MATYEIDTVTRSLPRPSLEVKADNRERILSFVAEREAIRLKRDADEPKPWTDDPILQQFRFCNVQRKHDRVTRWITINWRRPNEDDPDLWFAMAVARFINLPASLKRIGYPVPWDRERFFAVAQRRKERGLPLLNAAYIVGTGGKRIEKVEYLADLFHCLWKARKRLRPEGHLTLASYHRKLIAMDGIGNFMSAQIIADLKYTDQLRLAADWGTFAASGPGSRRGLNRLIGKPVDAHWNEQAWHRELLKLRDWINPRLQDIGMPKLHAQDLQNGICEFDKYERARLGQGRPKQRYDGAPR